MPITPPRQTQLAVPALAGETIGHALHRFETVTSTNDTAIEMARSGAPHGTVILADSQSAGKGRLGRSWHSPSTQNLYGSIVLRVLPPLSARPWVPLVTGLALVKMLRSETGVVPSLKWPNDILLEEKKLAGILCETTSHQGKPVLIVGIGMNINMTLDDLPEALRQSATSLAIATQRSWSRDAILAHLLTCVHEEYRRLLAGHMASLRTSYRQCCATVGRRVAVELHAGLPVLGTVEDIGTDGDLRVRPDRNPNGGVIAIRAGDVHHIRPQPSLHSCVE